MPATNGYAAKKALHDRLVTSATPGGGGTLAALAAAHPEWGPQLSVAYWKTAELGSLSIYGGGFTFTQDDAVEESPGVLVGESCSLLWYVRAQSRDPLDVAVTDDRVRQVANAMVLVFAAAPVLGGGLTVIGSRGGLADYDATDDEVWSQLGLTIVVGSLFGWSS